ncbi:hypothetical protein [Flavobacterium beibuense]|uniref:hypothetical protein n=1 Tax=Flavobacterium beibuense TaxID=657326 RepID=UPI003A94E953
MATDYNFSDSGLRKICKKHDIPIPPLGYWQKIQYGKKVKKTALQGLKETEIIIDVNKQTSKKIKENTIDYITIINSNKNLILKVPQKLMVPEKITVEIQENLKSQKPNNYLSPIGAVNTTGGLPDFIVTPKNISRSLKILDTLLKNFYKLGYTLSFKNRRFQITTQYGESLIFSIREKCNTKDEINKYGRKERYLIPNGKLSVKIDLMGTTEFVDKEHAPVEKQIVKILSKVLSGFDDARERARQWKVYRDEMEEARKFQEEKQKIKENELEKFRDFYNEAHRWKKYMILKEYFDYLNSQDNSLEKKERLIWAKEKLAWYNPLINKVDLLLNDVDKDKLEFKK